MLKKFNNLMQKQDHKDFMILAEIGLFISTLFQLFNEFINYEILNKFSLAIIINALLFCILAKYIIRFNKNDPEIVPYNYVRKYEKIQIILCIFIIISILNMMFEIIPFNVEMLFNISLFLISCTFILQTKGAYKLQKGEIKC